MNTSLRSLAHSVLLLAAMGVIPGRLPAASPDAILGGIGGAILLGSTTASNRLEQIYYLGTFDPDNRVPPTFFRIRVRGQSSLLGDMKFASGWIPAAVADGLATDFTAPATPTAGEASSHVTRGFGARFQQFGPEGFRIVPERSRLAIIMGSNPSSFFQMIDSFNAALALDANGATSITADQSLLKAELDRVIKEKTAHHALAASMEDLNK